MLLVHQGRLLLNLARIPALGDASTLPGGGQDQYESMRDALVREALEETGYTVASQALVGIYEEIYADGSAMRRQSPDYAHKVAHIFRCTLAHEERAEPTEQDSNQTGCAWLPLDALDGIPLQPVCVAQALRALLATPVPLFLGTHIIDRD